MLTTQRIPSIEEAILSRALIQECSQFDIGENENAMNETITGSTYKLQEKLWASKLNNHRFHELKFMPIYPYEADLKLSLTKKVEMLEKVIKYLENRGIQVTFTDRIMDQEKAWERPEGQSWRYLPIAELQGNNICINPRNIDFLSVFMSLGHIYGHLVQRMDYEKYKPLTDLLEIPKPMDLDYHFEEYRKTYGSDYKADFLTFEKEAFSYAKYTFQEAGIQWTDELEYAMNVYIEADFNELWKWIVASPQKSGSTFMDEFQKLWRCRQDAYTTLPAKEISVRVVPEENGSLVVVRNDKDYLPFL